MRFVYCLAYGEGSLVKVPTNTGTSQYWKLFYSCLRPVSANRDFGPILKTHTYDYRRIQNKIQLLRDLQAKGVWLVDASFVGINGQANVTKSEILRTCWKSHTGPMLKNLDPQPEHIVVIGTGVKNAPYKELGELGIERTEIPQPQANVRGGYWRHYQQCFEACSRVLKK